MKVSHVVPLFLALACVSVAAQTLGSNTPPVIIEQGPHHNLWQYQTYEPGPDGEQVAKLHRYRELASGLNYLDTNGLWRPAQAIIETFAGGAVGQQGQSRVVFANDLNTAGAIDVVGADGQRLRSQVLGLIYVDSSTGQSVLIAQLQDSEGELVAENQVLYPNAFAGVQADVKYTYRIDGLEQDVVLRERIAPPESYGLNSATTVLEVATEFISPPPAQVVDLNSGGDSDSDQTVRWGATWLGQGRAFTINGQAAPVRVSKQYTSVGGRYFLLEKVRWLDIQSGLSRLPGQASNAKRLPGLASARFVFPPAPATKSAVRPMRLALGTLPDKGYVLDYIMLTTAYTNYTFQSDSTYFISGPLTLAGTNIFEGGTVIKYATNGAINFVAGQPKFMSQPFHPVVLTAKDDNHLGQTISGSSGSPTGYYANPALNLSSVGNLALSEFRISYANRALSVSGASPAIYDAQLVNCGTVVSDINRPVLLENVLLSNNKTNFNASTAAAVDVENVTFNNQFDLINGNTNASLYLTNCVFVNATNLSGNIAAGYNGFYQSPMVGAAAVTNSYYPLQRAGAANCYLTNGCSFMNAGTTSVDPYLLGLLQAKTVYAPLVFSNLTFSVATNFLPQAPRDPNASALGYHYDPLDYAFSGVNVYSNVTFTAGTAVGWFELPNSGGGGRGLSIYDHVILSFKGTATSPCTFARYSTVQEGGNGLWSDLGYMGGIVSQSLSGGYGMNPTNAALISLDFTRCALLAEGPNQFRENSALSQVVAQNSEIWDGDVGAYWDYLSATNCLFDRVNMGVGGGNPAQYWLRNCTLHGGSLSLSKFGQTWPVWIEECAFDGASLAVDDNSGGNTNITYCDFNAFLTNGSQLPLAPALHNVTNLASFNWQSSWFGNFYQSTTNPLISRGSTTADKFGLYHFTTQTNQAPQTNGIVDIGYHYVATDALGNPLDSNGDGIPDYLEDANGDGLVDDGETNWALAILVQPESQFSMASDSASFSAVAGGSPAPVYQWYFNGSNLLAGATNSTLATLDLQTNNAGNYSVVVTNIYGTLTSSVAGLTVISWSATTPTNLVGGTAIFAISISAAPACPGPFNYQWQHAGTNIGAIITTAAGNYDLYASYSGDGGAATSAGLDQPNGVYVDNAGNLYIADLQNNVVRKVDANGIITTVAGNYDLGGSYSGDAEAATNATLNAPTWVSGDVAGNLYIADAGNDVIRKVDTNGVITTVAGNYALRRNYSGDGGVATNAGLSFPNGIAVDAAGNLYIADTGNNVIRKVNISGVITTLAGSYWLGGSYSGDNGSALNAGLYSPRSVAVDSVGNLYISDTRNNVVRKVDANGIITTVAGKLNPGLSYSGDGGAATNATLLFPNGISPDAAGNLYIADTLNDVVRKVDAQGIITTVAGDYSLGEGYSGDGGVPTNAGLGWPIGISVDPLGNLYIADSYDNVVREVVVPPNMDIVGGTLTLSNVTTAAAGTYQVKVTSPCGGLTTSATTLTVGVPSSSTPPSGN